MKSQMSRHMVLSCVSPRKEVVSFCKRRQQHEMEIIPYCLYVCMGGCVWVWMPTSIPMIMGMYLCASLCLRILCMCSPKVVMQHCMTPSKLWVKTGINLLTPTKDMSPKANSSDQNFPPLISILPADCWEYEIAFIYCHLTALNPQEPNLDSCIKKHSCLLLYNLV